MNLVGVLMKEENKDKAENRWDNREYCDIT